MKILTKRLLAALFIIWLLPQTVMAVDMLIPVGQVVGLELDSGTVTVAAFAEDSCARSAGVEAGDRITAVDGVSVSEPEDIRRALARSHGSVELTLHRSGKKMTLTVDPTPSPEGPRLGVYLRRGITGIGTVTFYDPETGIFGALGHGIMEGGSICAGTGSAYPARVTSVRRGKCGEPGQLMGALKSTEPLGKLYSNTVQGVFGRTDTPFPGEPMPVGTWDTVKTGKATILATIDGEGVQEYSVQIRKIYPATRKNGRNLLIQVTDETLLNTTGGIVQGMSGSPLVQDGKLIGAVTHVLVNDPTMGYGIFIENMLDAAG